MAAICSPECPDTGGAGWVRVGLASCPPVFECKPPQSPGPAPGWRKEAGFELVSSNRGRSRQGAEQEDGQLASGAKSDSWRGANLTSRAGAPSLACQSSQSGGSGLA